MDQSPKERIAMAQKEEQNVPIAFFATDKAMEEKLAEQKRGETEERKKEKNNKKHKRSKSGGVLLTKTTGVHWNDETQQMANEIAEEKSNSSSWHNEHKTETKAKRAHRRAKSHGAVRPMGERAETVKMKRWDKKGENEAKEGMAKEDKWTNGGERRRGHMEQQSAIVSPPVKTQKNKITVAKRRYSVFRHDSLMMEEMPQFTESDRRLRKSVPSSPQTIIVLAGLFVCGLILLISGLIVLWTNWQNSDAIPNGWFYHVAGCTMLLVGFAGLGICALLQRKNITKLAEDMSRDLFNVAANAATSEAKRASEEKAMAGGNKKLKRILAQVPSTMI